MRFLHTADIHLDSPLAGLRRRAGKRADELAGATRRAFQRLVQFAIDQKVDLLLIAGDNYDGRHRDYGSVLFFAREMQRLRQAGVRVVMIRGNHDAENQMELQLPAGVHLLPTDAPASISFDDIGVAVHGQSYPKRDVRQNLVGKYPDPLSGYLNIGLLHTAVEGYRGTHESYAPCTAADLIAKGYDYWALGHVHTRTEISTAPWIIYPGNLQARHINESGPKGATLVTVQNGRIAKVEPVLLDTVRWERLTLDISKYQNVDDVYSALDAAIAEAVEGADGRMLAIRVELVGQTPLHASLRLNAARLDAEVERAAEAAGDVWVEQVCIMTASSSTRDASHGDALAIVQRDAAELRAGTPEREKLKETISALAKKFPVTLQRELGLEDIDDNALDEIISDAQDILLDKLVGSS